MNSITGILTSIGIFIDSIVYFFVNMAYKVFLLVAEANLFDNGDNVLQEITDRMYSILGIVMLFILAYNIIKLIINPDKLSASDDTSLQGIAKNLVISIIIIVLLPTAFKYITTFQNRVLETNILGRLILGHAGDSDETENAIKEAGRDVALTIFSSFYYIVDNEGKIYTLDDCKRGDDVPPLCSEYVSAMSDAVEKGGVGGLNKNKALKQAVGEEVEYLWPISLIAGAIAAYMFLSFAIDLGVRVVKLGALQIIAPIPVILRVTKPKGGMFDKWFKEISKTYLMVFERLAIMYFAIFILQILCGSNGGIFANLPDAAGKGFLPMLFAKVILILGTLAFAKEAPKLIEDLVGIKLPEWRIKKKLDDNTYAKKLTSAVGTSALSLGTNLFKGKPLKALISAPTGLVKGWKNGDVKEFKNLGSAITKSRVETNQKVDKFEQKMHDIKEDGLMHVWDESIQKRKKEMKSFISGESEKNIQLDTAKTLETMFKTLFESFEDKNIKSAKDSALKDFYAGKDIILPKAITIEKFPKLDVNGKQVIENGVPQFESKTFNPGEKIPSSYLSEKDIKSRFDDMQMEKLVSKFNADEFKEAIADHGKSIIKELEKSRDIMGTNEETRKRIDVNISQLKDIFKADENGQIDFSTESIKKIQDVSSSISDNVKSLAFQAKTKKDAEGKK